MIEEKSARGIGISLATTMTYSLAGGVHAGIGGASPAGEDKCGITNVYPAREGRLESFLDLDESEDGN